jgi:hypothetical protein
MEREQAVAELQVITRPSPDPPERGVVPCHLRQQHAVRLAFADGVAALVEAHHPAVGLGILCQEPGGRPLLRGRGAGPAAAARRDGREPGAGQGGHDAGGGVPPRHGFVTYLVARGQTPFPFDLRYAGEE